MLCGCRHRGGIRKGRRATGEDWFKKQSTGKIDSIKKKDAESGTGKKRRRGALRKKKNSGRYVQGRKSLAMSRGREEYKGGGGGGGEY